MQLKIKKDVFESLKKLGFSHDQIKTEVSGIVQTMIREAMKENSWDTSLSLTIEKD